MVIDAKAKLAQWIKRKLGCPTINVEINPNTLNDNIDDAVQYFNRYAAQRYYRNALTFSLTGGQAIYDLPPNTMSIIDFDTTLTLGTGVTTLFTVENIFYNEGLLQLGDASSGGLISWEVAHQYLEILRDKLIPKFQVDIDKYNGKLKVQPVPKEDMIGILEVYTYWSLEENSVIFDEIWVKQYALALTKVVLGNIWGKYQGIPLPGGGTLSGTELKAEGREEKERLENEIMGFDGEPLGYFIG